MLKARVPYVVKDREPENRISIHCKNEEVYNYIVYLLTEVKKHIFTKQGKDEENLIIYTTINFCFDKEEVLKELNKILTKEYSN